MDYTDTRARTRTSVDPFGHSSMQQQLSGPASGFGGVTTARIDVQDFAERVLTRRLEWVWQTSPSLGESSQALYHELPMSYGAPSRLSWDIEVSERRHLVFNENASTHCFPCE